MAQFRVGIIGCGRPWKSPGASGFGMSNFHAHGYTTSPDATIVALADVNLDNARAFQTAHGGERIYTDYHEMLAREQLDIVSICTWPHLHAPMVIAAAEVASRRFTARSRWHPRMPRRCRWLLSARPMGRN